MQLKKLIVATALIGTWMLCNGQIQAQQPATPPAVVLKSQGIRVTMVDSPPNLNDKGDGPTWNSIPKRWIQVAFDFVAEEPTKGYIDEIKFKISVEAREYRDQADTQGVPVILTGETTFMNVPAKLHGSKLTGFFYVHPATIERYGGVQRFSDGKFVGGSKNSNNFNLRIESSIPLDVDGVNNYVDLLKDDPKWVDQCMPIAHQVIGKDLTPWAYFWLESTPAIRPTAGSGN